MGDLELLGGDGNFSMTVGGVFEKAQPFNLSK